MLKNIKFVKCIFSKRKCLTIFFFDKNRNFGQTIDILDKIQNVDRNPNIGQILKFHKTKIFITRSKFWAKIEICDKDQNNWNYRQKSRIFRQKSKFWTKSLIFGQKSILDKIEILDKNQKFGKNGNFEQKSNLWTKLNFQKKFIFSSKIQNCGQKSKFCTEMENLYTKNQFSVIFVKQKR